MDESKGTPEPIFRDEELLSILDHVRRSLDEETQTIAFRVLDPDRGRGLYSGELVTYGGVRFRHRPLRVWLDLADRLGLRLATPQRAEEPLIRLVYERLPESRPTTPAATGTIEERYGTGSPFARINKLEEAGFVLDVAEALDRVALAPDARVLGLGIGRGDELALLHACVEGFARRGRFVGVDHAGTALDVARARFPSPQSRFIEASLADLDRLDLGTFDLVISIHTLQSPGVDDRELLRKIVKRYLSPGGSVILGVPNCSYLDGEVMAGARMRNYRQAELGLLIKDVGFYRRYFQQHRRKVFVTGTHDVLITAIPD